MKRVIFLLLLIISIPTLAQETIQLQWNASTDNVGVAGYRVWVDGTAIGTTADIFYIMSLEPGMYDLTVSAFDAAGNESAQSYPLNVTIKDILPPSIPGNLRLDYVDETAMTLEWNESYDNHRMKGYNVYKDGEFVIFTSQPYLEMSGLTPSTLYEFAVTAVDLAGNESVASYPLSAMTNDPQKHELEMLIYPNPNYGRFKVVLKNGIIKNNTLIQVIATNGQMIYERLLPYGLTAPYESEFDLTAEVANGQYIVAIIEDGVRTMYSYIIVSKPKTYNL